MRFLETPTEAPGEQSVLFLVPHEVGYATVDVGGSLAVVDGFVQPREGMEAYFGEDYQAPEPRPLEELLELIQQAIAIQ